MSAPFGFAQRQFQFNALTSEAVTDRFIAPKISIIEALQTFANDFLALRSSPAVRRTASSVKLARQAAFDLTVRTLRMESAWQQHANDSIQS